MGSEVKLGELLLALTDYHANGGYKTLKENVELLDEPDHAIMIRTTNFEQSDFSNNVKYISSSAYEFLSKSKVYPNDLIMNKIANAGSVYLMPDLGRPVSLAMNLFLLRVDEKKANPLYVYIYLKINELYVKSFANGSVTKTITKDAVRNLDVTLPDITVQNRIVKYFSSLNDKITLNSQINQTLEQMAQALFKSWFVDFDPVIDNALDAGNPIPDALAERAALRQAARASDDFQPLPDNVRQLFPNEFEESELGWVPKGWECSFLNEVAEFGKERVSVNSLSLENYISTENMLQGKMGVEKASKLPTVSNALQYKSGSILVSNIRPYFKKIWFAKGQGGYSNDVLGFEVKNQGTQTYLFNLLYQDAFFDYMMTTSKGSKMPRGDKKAIMDLKITIPSIGIMKFYSEKLEPVYEAAEIRRNENKALASIRDTLLPKLISGELRLDSPEVEQAKSLLDDE